jgi:hypothetical protein
MMMITLAVTCGQLRSLVVICVVTCVVMLCHQEVKAAIHAESGLDWSSCSNRLSYEGEERVEPIYQHFM